MTGPASSLVNLERVSHAYGTRVLLDEVSLGVAAGERIGVVGRNGDGKTTLLEIVTGRLAPDGGRVSRTRDVRVGYLPQGDPLADHHTAREAVLGGRPDHTWAADPVTRQVVEELLAAVGLDREVGSLSGGERRRCALAALLLEDHHLLVLDEPTNHLDVEAVDWLARHLLARGCALLVVTHDRWFLDAVCERTWEVHDGLVDGYEGGYAAFVLARAERMRQASAGEARRRSLVRKELAWLRRGPPARTTKPRFRVDAANALIADVPPPRDRLALQRFAAQRLGRDVLDVEDVDLARGERPLLERATWRLGPGDRVGVVGVNGSGKTSLLQLLAGTLTPSAGRVRRGRTVALAHLTQEVEAPAGGPGGPGGTGGAPGPGGPGGPGAPGAPGAPEPGTRVLEAVEAVRRVTRTLDGEVTATAMLERFGFTGDRLTARLGDLSGGERRRFQLLYLLLGEPNVLLLDEPTNDLDIDTLTVLEDFLDGWPGTLVVVTHDRWFLERVTDTVVALLGDGAVSMLPRGVEEYLERRRTTLESARLQRAEAASRPVRSGVRRSSDTERAARKALDRLDRQLATVAAEEARLHAAMAEAATDHQALTELADRLHALHTRREALETEWLEVAESLQ